MNADWSRHIAAQQFEENLSFPESLNLLHHHVSGEGMRPTPSFHSRGIAGVVDRWRCFPEP